MLNKQESKGFPGPPSESRCKDPKSDSTVLGENFDFRYALKTTHGSPQPGKESKGLWGLHGEGSASLGWRCLVLGKLLCRLDQPSRALSGRHNEVEQVSLGAFRTSAFWSVEGQVGGGHLAAALGSVCWWDLSPTQQESSILLPAGVHMGVVCSGPYTTSAHSATVSLALVTLEGSVMDWGWQELPQPRYTELTQCTQLREPHKDV